MKFTLERPGQRYCLGGSLYQPVFMRPDLGRGYLAFGVLKRFGMLNARFGILNASVVRQPGIKAKRSMPGQI